MVKSKEFLSYVSGILLVGAALGCAGNGSNPAPVAAFESVGTVSSSEELAPTTIPASEEDQTVTVGGVEALVPPGEEIPAGTPVALIGAGTSPLGELDSDDSEALTRGPIGAYLWQDGKAKRFYEGLVTRDGLTRNLLLAPGKWHIEMFPCYVSKTADPTHRMTMQKILFNFVVGAEGRHSLPRVAGVWPRNGTRLTNANYAIATVNGAFAGKPCRLLVSNGSVTLSKSLTYVPSGTSASAQFRDIQASQIFVLHKTKGVSRVIYDSGF